MKLPVALALIVGGAALTAGAAALSWATAVATDELRGAVRVPATGADLEPALLPLAGAALAGLGAMLATRGAVRRFIGGLLAVLGGFVLVLGVRGLLADPVRALAGASPSAPGTATVQPLGPIADVAGGGCLLLAGVVLLLGRVGGRGLGDRHERSQRAEGGVDTELTMWKELDAHRDPTLKPALSNPRDRLDPSPGGQRPNGEAAR